MGLEVQGHEAFPIIPTSLSSITLQIGSEDSLSYTLSLEPETGCHLCHAWTQTEPPHLEAETVRRNCPAQSSGYRGEPFAWGEIQADLGKHRKVKRCKGPELHGQEGTDRGSFLMLIEK